MLKRLGRIPLYVVRWFIAALARSFQNVATALVQTPQEFYNVDSFQHRFDPVRCSAWNEQELFFHRIMPGKAIPRRSLKL